MLVHGLNGSANTWKSPGDYVNRINAMSKAIVFSAYGYDTQKLGSDLANISGGLTDTVDCAARISKQQGGPGKVILVGYSMGALLSHITANTSADDGTPLSNEIAQVITIADPARSIFVGGRSAGNLPVQITVPIGQRNFPKSVPVHAVAGSQVNYGYFEGVWLARNPFNSDDDSDGLIKTSEALTFATRNPDGGRFTIQCGYRKNTTWWGRVTEEKYGSWPCNHENLLDNTHVQDDVLANIKYTAQKQRVNVRPNNPRPVPTPTSSETVPPIPAPNPTGTTAPSATLPPPSSTEGAR